MRYWTWRAISWSERGGRKEKVSKNLRGEGARAGGDRSVESSNPLLFVCCFPCQTATRAVGRTTTAIARARRRARRKPRSETAKSSTTPSINFYLRDVRRRDVDRARARASEASREPDKTQPRWRLKNKRRRRARAKTSRARESADETNRERSNVDAGVVSNFSARLAASLPSRARRETRRRCNSGRDGKGREMNFPGTRTCCSSGSRPASRRTWRPCRWRRRGPWPQRARRSREQPFLLSEL